MHRAPHAARAILFAATALATAGCVEAFGDKDPHEPGEPLGTYHITATQTQNDCGDGALGAQPVWEFDVHLAWQNEHVFWDSGGEVIVGTLSPDGDSFAIEAHVVMDMRTEEDAGLPPCSIDRWDGANGTLARDGDAVTSVSGTLSYAFAPTQDSECSDLVQSETPVFAAMPCSMAYTFDAPRVGD